MKDKEYNYEKIQEILNDVRVCTLLCCTQDGQVYSVLAEKYLEWLGSFSKYCIPEMNQDWQNTIREIVYSVLVPNHQFKDNPDTKKIMQDNEYEIIDNLYNFMDAGEIMKTYAKTHSWEQVNNLIKEQGHSGWTFAGLSNVLIQYSPIGVDFIEKFNPERIKHNHDFKRYYDVAKNYKDNRQELNKRLIRVLASKKVKN